MMDRPFPALTALVAVVLLAAAWLVMPRPHEQAEAPANLPATAYRCPTSAEQAHEVSGQSQPRYHVPAVIDWLPSLSDQTRNVLAEYAVAEGEPSEAAGPDLLPTPEARPADAAAEPEPVALLPAAELPVPPASAEEKAAPESQQPEPLPKPAAQIAPETQAEQTPAAEPPQLAVTKTSEAHEVEPEAAESATAGAEAAEAEQLKPDLLLVPAYDASSRSRELEMIARQADAHTKYGFELASKGAYFSARLEFIMALRLVAQGLDSEYRTKAHSRTLAAALTALSEAEDFLPRGTALEADLDVPEIVRTHRTPVLHDVSCDRLTALDAVQSYLTFAQEQLGYAAGEEVAGSMALYGLGKLHKTLAEKAVSGVRGARSKAVVFYQASLLVSPRNFMASNDLGVLLAQAGRYEDARAALEHSLAISPQPTGWRNLAIVYDQLGEAEAARKADGLARAEGSDGPASGGQYDGVVRWVDPYTFAQAAGQTLPASAAASPGSASPAARSPASAPASSPKQASDWLPWKSHDARK